MATKERPSSMALRQYSDVELMHLVDDLTDPDSGWADATLIADRIGIKHENPVRCVVVRFSWMRRYGAIEKNDEEKGKYRLSDLGEEIINASLTKGELALITKMQDRKLLDLMVSLTSRWGAADQTVRKLVSRQWTYGSQ